MFTDVIPGLPFRCQPHKFSCSCMECRNRMKFDQLRMANFRLNAYRGLSSEAYISLSSDDPFLTGFLLAKELRKLSDDEKHFKVGLSSLKGWWWWWFFVWDGGYLSVVLYA